MQLILCLSDETEIDDDGQIAFAEGKSDNKLPDNTILVTRDSMLNQLHEKR